MNAPIFQGRFGTQNSLVRRERRPVTMQGSIATDDGTSGDALILDLSYEGCGVETALSLVPGQTITLWVDGGNIRADVRWFVDGKAGLVFHNERASEPGGEPRANQRVPLEVVASMRRLGMPSYSVNVTNLSPDGCKVDCVERPRVGEHLLLKFDELDAIDCQVCWVEDYFAGLRFDRPIHAAVFELMVQRLSARR
jgi:hypothetical protein